MNPPFGQATDPGPVGAHAACGLVNRIEAFYQRYRWMVMAMLASCIASAGIRWPDKGQMAAGGR